MPPWPVYKRPISVALDWPIIYESSGFCTSTAKTPAKRRILSIQNLVAAIESCRYYRNIARSYRAVGRLARVFTPLWMLTKRS